MVMLIRPRPAGTAPDADAILRKPVTAVALSRVGRRRPGREAGGNPKPPTGQADHALRRSKCEPVTMPARNCRAGDFVLLKGLKVVEFATYIAAPGAAGILGDWGAEVTKVERAQGDPMRNAFADAKNTFAGNPHLRGGQSAASALWPWTPPSLPAARPSAKLAASADVFITNVRPAALKRSRTGRGHPARRQPATWSMPPSQVTAWKVPTPTSPALTSTAFWSRAGVARMHTPKGSEPFILRTGVGDHTTSLAHSVRHSGGPL